MSPSKPKLAVAEAFQPKLIRALAVESADACLAATDAGLWRWRASAQGQGSWSSIAPQFETVPLLSVAVSADQHTIWIGSEGDLAVSRDDGASWGLATLPIRAEILAIAPSPTIATDGLLLTATTRDGVLRSTDGGATFHAWNFGLLEMGINALTLSPAFADDGCALAASDHAVFISRNGGRAWRELDMPTSAAPFTALGFDGDTLLIGTESAGLWRMANVNSAPVRVAAFKSASINVIEGAFLATPDAVFVRAGDAWRAIDQRGALCLARVGGHLLASDDQPGLRAITFA
jgi:hypothetical protein